MNISSYLASKYGIELIKTDKGHIAQPRPDSAELAYEVAINAPLTSEDIDDIVRFGQGASEPLIRELYGNFNGLNIGATKFAIYGMRIDCSGSDWKAHLNIPFDLNEPNFLQWSRGLEETSLVVAQSVTYNGTDTDTGKTTFIHTIDADNKISKRPIDRISDRVAQI